MGKNNKHMATPDNLDSIPTAIIQCTNRTVYYANKTAKRFFGNSQKFPVTLNEYFGDNAAREIRSILRMRKNQGFVIHINDKVFDVKKGSSPKNSNRRELFLNDVTDIHRKMEEEKQASEVFQTIVENSEDGISIVEGDRFLFVNQKFLELFGYSSAKQLIGKPFSIVVAPDDRKRVLSTSRARQSGKDVPFLYDYKGRKRNGRIIDIEVAASFIQFEGKPASLSFHRDVTERNSLEMQLIESEEFRKNVFSSLEQGVIVFDENLRCLDCNNQMEYFTDIECRAVVGMHATEIFEKFEKYGALEKFNNVLAGTKVSSGYLEYFHPSSKQSRYAWLYLSPLLSSDGSVRGIVGTLSDLTHQKFMQDDIKESETLFRNVLEAMGDALVLTDLQGRVFRVNKEFERITGYREDEAVGQTIPYSWFYEPDTARFVVWISELRNKNYLHDFDIRWKSKSGNIIPVSLNTTLLKNKEGDSVAMLNMARDITDRKKLETELQNRTQQIELINRVISKANETIEINDLLNTLDRELRQLIACDLFGLILLRGTDTVEEVAFTIDAETKQSRRKEHIGTNTSLGLKVRSWKKPFLSNNLSNNKSEIKNLPLVKAGYNSLAAVPIYTKDTFLGILYIATRQKNGFNGNEIDLLQPICEQIGLIVDKLNLFTRVRDDAQYIHNLLYSMDDIVFTVNNDLIITETNTPFNEFPFVDIRKSGGKHKSLIGRALYDVLINAPYREGIEQVIDALFSGNLTIFTTEFVHTIDGDRKYCQLRINPMKVEGRIVGLVFTHTDITALKKTEAELKSRNRDLTILASLGNIYASSLDIDEIAESVLERIDDLRQPDVLTISLLDKPAGKLRLVAAKGIPQEKLSHSYNTDHPVIEKIIDNSDYTIIEDIENEYPELYDYFIRKDQRSVGFFLLKVENEILGALSVGFVNFNKFFPEDVALYRNIATQVTMAIQNAQLYRKIQISEEKYRLLVETAQDMVISMDLDGNFTYVSPSAKHLTGYDPEMILKQRFNPRMIHPGDYRDINKLLRLAIERQPLAEPVRALEFRIRTRSGNYRWMSASWTLMHNEQGRVTGVQCILRDVHERRLAEEEITHQLERLRVLYELAHELAATLDRNDILVTVSKSVTRVLPHLSLAIYLYDDETPDTLQQILKIGAADGIPIMEKPEMISLNNEAYKLERQVIEERRLCDIPGDWNKNHKIVAPMIIKKKVLGLFALEAEGADTYSETHKDLLQTIAHLAGIAIEKALLYQETVEKSEVIQRRNRELDDFTYVVSHDLKEPLISIEGYSKIVLADYSDTLHEDGVEMLTSISQSCYRMKNLINELLDLSRVGRLTESMTPVSINDVVKEILDDLEYTIKKRKVSVEVENNLPIVLGNRVHIVVLFRNLVVNGVKFNSSEHPVIRIGWNEEDSMYRFNVSDNGIGIERDSFDKIFTIFHRLRTEFRYEGTGAGLTIVKKIVETHGGRIWLDSTVGKGTTFYFTLPKP